jgi:hypothetical protein
VELEELDVLQRQALAPHDADAVAGEGGRSRWSCRSCRAAGGEDDGLGVEDVEVAGGQLVGDDAGDRFAVGILHRDEIERVTR